MHEGLEINNSPNQEIPPSIIDPDEAVEFIESLWEKGERPVVTVPSEYENELSSGLRAHATWIPGVNVIAGTFGREPYQPEGEDRLVVEVDVPTTQISPRFTGPDNAFHGVVVIQGPIPPEQITIH